MAVVASTVYPLHIVGLNSALEYLSQDPNPRIRSGARRALERQKGLRRNTVSLAGRAQPLQR